jgi:hypothetical protein
VKLLGKLDDPRYEWPISWWERGDIVLIWFEVDLAILLSRRGWERTNKVMCAAQCHHCESAGLRRLMKSLVLRFNVNVKPRLSITLILTENHKELHQFPMSYMFVAAFNKELEGLINLVQKKFPDDVDVQQTKAKIELANYMSPKAAAVGFMEFALNVVEEIKRRDDAFFLEKGAQSPDLAHLKLDEKWGSFDSAEKKQLWDHVQAMEKWGRKMLLAS